MNWKLNEDSKTIKQPEKFVGELRPHQLAMFYRALCIERQESNYAFGFLADKAGTGKTPVIISLMLADKQVNPNKKYQTMIIVPQNLIKQWIKEIERFSGGSIAVRELIYEDVINIESHGTMKSLREYDCLITTQDLFESIMSSLGSNGNTIYRIVYDEIDTMDKGISKFQEKRDLIKYAKNKFVEENKKNGNGKQQVDFIPPAIDRGLKNKITWFVSASIYNMIDPKDGFFFLGKQIPNNELSKLFVKCENQFINENIPEMEEEEEEIYECECIADYYEQFMSVDQLDSINSLSYSEVKLKNRRKVPNNDNELLKMLIKQYYTEMEDIKETIIDYKQKAKNWDIDPENVDHPINNKIYNQEKDYKLKETLISKFYEVSCKYLSSQGILIEKDQEQCIYKAFDKISETPNTKIKVLKEIFNKCINEAKALNQRPKILVFSDFQGSFKHLPPIIDEFGLKYEDLCKGTAKGINEAIEKYKNGNIDVIFIQSRTDGCGLNLENTSHLIFMHRTSEKLRDQILGRAQRQGRVGTLKVISLYNKNENIDDDDESSGNESSDEESDED